MSPPAASTRPTERVLPLSTALVPALSHPLLSPVLARLASLESLVLTSAPASVVLGLGLSPTLVSLVSLVSLAAALVRVRAQWRLLVALVGVGEAVGRSVSLLEQLDRLGVGAGVGQERQRQRERDSETKHLVCWWAVYALVELACAYRPTAALRVPRALVRLVQPRTRLDRRPPRSPFPQPAPLPRPTATATPTAARLSEPATEALKLVLRWTALRTDGLGASALWDHLLAPILALRRARRKGCPTSRIVVVVLDHAPPADSIDSPPPAGQQDCPPSPHSPTPHTHSRSSSATTAAAPPTPAHISYRLTSSSHPIHARSPFESDGSPSPRRPGPYAPRRADGYDVDVDVEDEQGWSGSQSAGGADEGDERWS